MPKSAHINIRIDPKTKDQAEQLFSNFGITVTDAINMFLHQSIISGGLPFELKLPQLNAETLNAMEETKTAGKKAKEFTDVKDLFKELDS